VTGSSNICYAKEHSQVDPNKKHMILKTVNLTFCGFLSVYETLHYSPHPTDPSKTLLKQEATVSVEGVPLNTYMEDVLTKRISVNAGRGRQGLEWVIDKINTEVSSDDFLEFLMADFLFSPILGQKHYHIRRHRNR
jgi:PRELI-like family